MQELEDLVVRAQEGDGGAYDEIYRRFKGMALSYAFSILGDYETAEDVRQEAFLAAYCELVSLRAPAAFPAWLRTIVRNQALALQRGDDVLFVPLDDAPEAAAKTADPRQGLVEDETYDRVRDALELLPETEREAARLFYVENLSHKEAARRLGTTPKVLKARLHRARELLRQRLARMVGEEAKNRRRRGDRSVTDEASVEAIALFRRERRGLARESEKKRMEMAELFCAEGRLLRFMGRTDEALETFREALGTPLLLEDPIMEARLHAEVGLTLVQACDAPAACRELETAREELKAAGGSPLLGACIANGLGMCAWAQGEYAVAKRRYLEAAKAADRAECPELGAQIENNLALLAWKKGRLEEALAAFRKCMRAWTKLGDRFGRAAAMMHVGIMQENLGRLKPARRTYREALALAEALNYAPLKAACASNLASLSLTEGRFHHALKHSETALDAARESGDRTCEVHTLENLTRAHLAVGALEEARRVMEEALPKAKRLGNEETALSLDLADLELRIAEQRFRGMMSRIQGLRKRCKQGGYGSQRPRLRRLEAEAALAHGRRKEALRRAKQALDEASKQKNKPEAKLAERFIESMQAEED